MTSSTLKKLIPAMLILVAALAMITLTACGKRGDAEKAGEKVDDALDDAGDKAEDLIDRDGPAEKAGEKVDDALDR